MGFKEKYYYVFYKFFKLFNKYRTTRWLVDVKAVILLCILEFWLIFPFYIYFIILTNRKIAPINSIVFVMPFLIIVLSKWLVFYNNSQWIDYNKKFDSLSVEFNKKGAYIVAGITIVIFFHMLIAGLIFRSHVSDSYK